MKFVVVASSLTLIACQAPPSGEPINHHQVKRVERQIRPTDGNGWNGNGYGAGVTVKSYASPGGWFRVHYTLDGTHAVPKADTDNSGVPDFAEDFGKTFDQVYKTLIQTRGFRPPLDDSKYHDRPDYGGDSRFDVYLQDMPTGGADGYMVTEACNNATPKQCAGYMVVDNDFKEYSYPTAKDGMEVLSSHEFFHAMQNAYRYNLPRNISEGSAVWATEQVFPKQKDFEGFARVFFKQPERSLDHDQGLADSFPYSQGVWFQFLGEKFGVKAIPAVLEELSEKGISSEYLLATDVVLKRDHKSSLTAAYAEFALWNYFTGSRSFGYPSYKEAANYAEVTVTSQSAALPTRISGEIAYLGARYHKVKATKGSWVKVTSERPAAKLALHLITWDTAGKAKIVSGKAEQKEISIMSTGEVSIVAASTATSDRHIPYSLAVVPTTGPVNPTPDSGVKPGADGGTTTPPDPGDEGCSVAHGAGRAGGLALLPLLLVSLGWRRRRSWVRSAAAVMIACSLCLAGACSDDTTEQPDSGVTPDAKLNHDGIADSVHDGAATPDGATGALKVGQFTEFKADTTGKVSGSTSTSGSEQFILLLLSDDTTALASHKYTVSQGTGSSSKASPGPTNLPRPAAPGPGVRRCKFHQKVQAILDSKPDRLREDKPYLFAGTPPKKGDTRTFKIRDGSTVKTITAKCVHVDTKAAFWLDDTTTPKASIDAQSLTDLADGFGKTILPREQLYFGKESDINSDGLVGVLLSPLVSKSAMAYVSPCDLLDPKVVTYCGHSNEMELIYLSPPSSLSPPYNTAKALLETIAHEFQHAIYFHRKFVMNNITTTNENPYITEGLSALAQDLSGYQAGNLYVQMMTLQKHDVLAVPNLLSSKISSYVPQPNDGYMRGGEYFLMRYLFDQAGGESLDSKGMPVDKGGLKWLHAFIDSKDTGETNATKTSGLTLDTLAGDFWTAMALSNRGTGGAAINPDKRYNFLPTTSDPFTARQRGCNLHAAFHGTQLTGPKLTALKSADGMLRPGGAEFLNVDAPGAGGSLTFSVTVPAAAKARVRLIRIK